MFGEKRGIFGTLALIPFVLCAIGVVCFLNVDVFTQPNPTETKTLTILHTWEEGGHYYFADELGCVYHIGCWGNKGEIRYNDMPKIRFDGLEEGNRYNVEYTIGQSNLEYIVRKKNIRVSLSEKEMEK